MSDNQALLGDTEGTTERAVLVFFRLVVEDTTGFRCARAKEPTREATREVNGVRQTSGQLIHQLRLGITRECILRNGTIQRGKAIQDDLDRVHPKIGRHT